MHIGLWITRHLTRALSPWIGEAFIIVDVQIPGSPLVLRNTIIDGSFKERIQYCKGPASSFVHVPYLNAF